MEGAAVWSKEGGGTKVVIGLVVSTSKVIMGESVTRDPKSYRIS